MSLMGFALHGRRSDYATTRNAFRHPSAPRTPPPLRDGSCAVACDGDGDARSSSHTNDCMGKCASTDDCRIGRTAPHGPLPVIRPPNLPKLARRAQGVARHRGVATGSAVGSPQSNVAVGCASSHGGCDAPPDDRHRPRPARTSAHDARCVCNDDIDAAILPLAASDSSSGAVSGTMWDTTSCVRVARVCGHDAHCTRGASYTHRMAPTASRATALGGAAQPLTASDSSSGMVWDTTTIVRVARMGGDDAHCTRGASCTNRIERVPPTQRSWSVGPSP